MAATVNVENISTKTSEDEIKSFFSFCGKIQALSVKHTGDDTQSASVSFEKAAAAKTALLLDNTQLGPNSVKVTSTKSIDEIAGEKAAAAKTALLLDNTQLGPNSVKVTATKSIDELAGEKAASAEDAKDGDHHIEQEQKPRARIIAEYLAHGYVISDKAIESALDADKKNGYSTKFLNAINSFDQKTQATQKAQVVDQKLGVTNKAYAVFGGLQSYFEKAANTPTGQKLRTFYEQGNKTVMDVHNEARHLADLKKANQSGKPSAEEMNLHTLPGSDKTQCNCAADTGKCPCEPGKCACSGCAKAKDNGNEKSESYAAAVDPTQ